jgi:ABC-type Fe3+-siderophore transport system permease subunit
MTSTIWTYRLPRTLAALAAFALVAWAEPFALGVTKSQSTSEPASFANHVEKWDI